MPSDFFQVLDTHAVWRPVGAIPLPEVMRLMVAAVALARERGAKRLLIVATGITDLASPSTLERFFLAQDAARAAGGGIRLAMVVPRELIHPQRFGRTVAANRGLSVEVFESEVEALPWLHGTG